MQCLNVWIRTMSCRLYGKIKNGKKNANRGARRSLRGAHKSPERLTPSIGHTIE
jgi:hypothetical protein